METLYRKVILNIVDRCFHMYASDYRKEAKESAIEMLEEIPDPTTQLKADKAELLEELEKISKVTNEGYITDDTDFQVWESELKQVHSEIESLIQKHKQ